VRFLEYVQFAYKRRSWVLFLVVLKHSVYKIFTMGCQIALSVDLPVQILCVKSIISSCLGPAYIGHARSIKFVYIQHTSLKYWHWFQIVMVVGVHGQNGHLSAWRTLAVTKPERGSVATRVRWGMEPTVRVFPWKPQSVTLPHCHNVQPYWVVLIILI